MRQVDSVEKEVRSVGVGAAVLVAVLCSALQGCAVPALLGVKSYQSGDTRIEFITGADIGFSMNGIDQVNNSRGIAPVSNDGASVKKASSKY